MKTLPVIHQTEATECGLASLIMVANYHGHDFDLNAIRQDYPVSLKGATLQSIMSMAADFQLAPRALRLDMEHLTELQLPAIMHWDMSHFVVLKKVAKGKAHIHDPGRGLVVMSLKEFSKHFTGVALELTPTADFTADKKRLKAHLSQLWSKLIGLKRALFQTIILSIILQALILVAPFYLQFVVDGAIPKQDYGLLMALALGFAGILIIRAIAEAVRSWAILVYGNQMSFQMVGNVFSHLIRLPAAYYEKRHVGDIISRMNSTQPIQQALTQGVVAVLIDGAMAIFTLVIMFSFSPKLALVVLVSVLLMVALTLVIFPHLRRTQEEAITTRAIENSHLIESIRASTTLKLFGAEASRESSWRNLFADYINANTEYGKWSIGQRLGQSLLMGLQGVLIVYLAAQMIMAGSFSVGQLIAFMAFAMSFSSAAGQLVQKGIEFKLLGLHLERLSDIIYAQPESQISNQADDIGLRPNIQGQVTLKDVSFQYSPDDPWVLTNINETVKSGEMVAFTGRSGGGKTTLMKLILGLYHPQKGEIIIDDTPMRCLNLAHFRKNIGVVMQDDTLIKGTLADNISFFDPNLDKSKVVHAAKMAQIHDEIMAMPMQYLSLVGDMGSVLSGGQRQRVLLARALYNRPKILFLDEGTANLDVSTEKQIAQIISKMPITRIIVAHRPAFLEQADRIIDV